MCGIAGILQFDGYQGDSLRCDGSTESDALAMLHTLHHRGPDDGGLLIDAPMYLGHRRLSILDCTPAGHQPMGDPTQRYWLSFNGEIYNHRKLRIQMEEAGVSFFTRSDTEVLLRALLHWGNDALRRLDGMFAFALWDRGLKKLWLARDGFGIKPLFYTIDGNRLVFGSEVKAILAAGVRARPNRAGLGMFLALGYSAAPNTGFEGIQQLLPGHELMAGREQSTVETRQWYRLPYPAAPEHWSRQESADRLRTALESSVHSQMQSDVPLGGLLSGGLDSSAVVRCMAMNSDRPIDSFTIAFEESSFDESLPAASVAQFFATRHHCPKVNVSDFEVLNGVVEHAEDPIADNSLVAFWSLCRETASHVTVALGGDGADELLAGYATYRATQLASAYRWLPFGIRRGVFQPIVGWLPASDSKYSLAMFARRFVTGAEHGWPLDHCSWRTMLDSATAGQLGGQELQEQWNAALRLYSQPLSEAPDWLSPLEQQLHLDLCFHLPNDMLVKVDRMSMAHSLEVRVPYLGNEVVETCLAIPSQWKRRGAKGKIVLRDSMRPFLPHRIVDRKKAGFVIPIEAWLRGAWREPLLETLTPDFCEATQMIRPEALQSLLSEHYSKQRDHSYTLFTLLIFALWWRTWIESTRSPRPYASSQHNIAPTRITRLTSEFSR